MKKIGIMGGTFDPIHIGHLWLAQNALEELFLDKVIFVPSGVSYLKENVLDARARLDMTGLAIKDNTCFDLSTIEIDRVGPSYTYETVASLKETYQKDELFFLLGADSLFSMEEWLHPELIFKDCVIVAARRAGDFTNSLEEKVCQLKNKYGADIRILPVGQLDISSTMIRNRIAQKKTVKYMVLDKVIDYINKNNIYR